MAGIEKIQGGMMVCKHLRENQKDQAGQNRKLERHV